MVLRPCELRDKLDTVEVNGPEGGLEWDVVAWRLHEENVTRLRHRIFKAARNEDWARVRSLQKMMLGSWSNTLVSVRQVTQRNTGRRTAGIDGEVALSSQARAVVAERVHRDRSSWDPVPVRRVFIPKANGKQRPLGIPVIMDRCHQARVRNALEPEWEARFESRSYGFRPGRSCADAIGALYNALKGSRTQRVWILDADLSAAFDKIDHARLLENLGSFPARDQIRGWLKTGVVEEGMLIRTEEGTPQGGVISPLLMNVALHGMEEAAGVRYRERGVHAGIAKANSPILVRYADDLVVCCHTEQQAQQVKARLAEWLAPRGLVFNEDKTQVVHLEDGFNFLGFNLRRYRRGDRPGKLDHYMWKLTYRWACHSHPKKSKKWIVRRYFGRFNRFRNDWWVFGARDHSVNDRGDVAFLTKFSWTTIVRHQLVTGWASPDDPDLADYWAARRRKVPPPLDGYNLRLLSEQGGRCLLCGDHLLSPHQPPQSPRDWERWWLNVVKRAIAADYLTHQGRDGRSDGNRTRLVHASCNRSLTARQRRSPVPSTAMPTGLA